jgi:hypothetical protein
MARLGMLVGHCTILREVKRSAQTDANAPLVRVAGIDDWAWKKGVDGGANPYLDGVVAGLADSRGCRDDDGAWLRLMRRRVLAP